MCLFREHKDLSLNPKCKRKKKDSMAMQACNPSTGGRGQKQAVHWRGNKAETGTLQDRGDPVSRE